MRRSFFSRSFLTAALTGLVLCGPLAGCNRNSICPEPVAEAPSTMGPNAKKKKSKGGVHYTKNGTLKRKANQPMVR